MASIIKIDDYFNLPVDEFNSTITNIFVVGRYVGTSFRVIKSFRVLGDAVSHVRQIQPKYDSNLFIYQLSTQINQLL